MQPTGLDDLCVRFIINLPREELESVERICFQVEEAQWFYEDFIRPLDPALPSLSLKAFALRIFQHCPLMSQWSHYHHITAFSEFLAYKTRVPVRGAILLNQEMDEVVLVKGWKKGANWSFPRGKINKGEKDLDCAIREVYEETGFDIRDAGLVKDENDVKFIEITMREQHMQLYVFRGVPRETHFEPRTRKEISKIEWYKLSELPTLRKNKQHDEGCAVANANKFYMVAPFLHPLKKWIAQQKKLDSKVQAGAKQLLQEGYTSLDETGQPGNGAPAPQSPAELAIPSDLPEVTSVQDASSHLKRLLNINAGAPAPAQVSGLEPIKTSAIDPSKSNALLALLRSGSSESVPQALRNDNMPSNNVPPPPPLGAQPPHLAPNFFPGFPQQHQHMGPSVFTQQTSSPFHHGATHPHTQTLVNPQRPHAFPPVAHSGPAGGLPAMPQFPQPIQRNHQNGNLQSPLYPAAPPRHFPAPFQQTGDPQFSQSAQPTQVQGATVPPASKLPPPKLTSHSLALLNVFKNDSSKTPKNSGVAMTLVPGESPQAQKTTQHQDSLLSLLKGPRTVPAPQPIELSAHSVPSAESSEEQLLQRLRNQTDHSHRSMDKASEANVGVGQTSATVSGPLKMPQLDAIAKPTPKKSGGLAGKINTNRQTQVQPLSSPITILPRPQTAKRDPSSSEQAARPPLQSPTHKPEGSPGKPFQPQILRRSDKPTYDNLLMSKLETAERKPSLPGLQTPAQEPIPQNHFDRRPSQTAAQREALLSLFGKPTTSPPPTRTDSRAVHRRSSATPGVVSPLSSLHLPSSGESTSQRGTPSEGDMHTSHATQLTSPTNKAFLLGFLEGVAKGNK